MNSFDKLKKNYLKKYKRKNFQKNPKNFVDFEVERSKHWI